MENRGVKKTDGHGVVVDGVIHNFLSPQTSAIQDGSVNLDQQSSKSTTLDGEMEHQRKEKESKLLVQLGKLEEKDEENGNRSSHYLKLN
ncbi:hypothetical protein NC651_029967 [Populus alba x Populus x berolinensis]|nr:hypothetical protein NC651_029967 [Populus alba x Populus x berolinensis]